MAFTSMPKPSGLARNLFVALFLCLLLLGYGLIRYRGLLIFSRSGLLFAGLLLVLTVLFVAYAYIGREISEGFGRDEMWAQQQGLNFGILAALFWLAQVAVDTINATPNRVVDIICIGGVIVVTFLAGLYGAWHTHSFSFGLRIGLWSGMLSSLVAWVALLLLTYVLLPRLQLYPLSVQGFAHSGDADIATYIVRNAMFVAAGHLVLGPVLGLALGALGALPGKALSRPESSRQPEEQS